MATDQFEYSVGAELRDRYGRPEYVIVPKHDTPLSTDVPRGYQPADQDGRLQLVIQDKNGNDISALRAMASAYLVPSGGDDSAVMQAALTNFVPFAQPIVMLGPGTFQWNSAVPGFKRNQPATVHGTGVDKTFIRLSASAPRAFDVTKVADGDTFTGIELSDFSVDANNVTGKNHVIFGNYINGGLTGRINYQGIRISRVRSFNVPSAVTTGQYDTSVLHRLNIHISPADSVAFGTQYNVTDIIIRDVRMEGGNEGIYVGATGISTDGLNIFVDRVYIYDCWHSTMGEPTQFFASANFQIGSRAFGDSCGIFNCYGFGSGDVGIEVDSLVDIQLATNTIVDSWNSPFYFTNFHTPQTDGTSNGVAQRVTWDRCFVHYTNLVNPNNNGSGWKVTEQLSIPLGQLTIRDCEFLDLSGAANLGTSNNGRAINLIPNQVDRIVINGFRAWSSGWSYNSATPTTYNHIYISINNSSLPEVQLTMRDIETNMNYNQAGAGAVNYDAIFLASGTASGGGIRLNIDDVRIFVTATGSVGANSLRGIELNSGQNIGGSITNVKTNFTGDTAPRGILIRAQAQPLVLTRLNIERCDFSNMPAGGVEILWTDAPNKALTHTHDNIWRNQPAPALLTALASGTGKAVGTGWDAMVIFLQGSGTLITAIDVSVNNGVSYTGVLTQAAGALPAGFSQEIGPLPSDALIKVTFGAGSQPIVNLVPVSP